MHTTCPRCKLLFLTSYEVVQGGMVKAVLLNGAGKYYTIFCHVAIFVFNLVTAAIESATMTTLLSLFFLNYDLVATEVPYFNPLAASSKFPHLHIST